MLLDEAIFNANLYRDVEESGHNRIAVMRNRVVAYGKKAVYVGYPSVPWEKLKEHVGTSDLYAIHLSPPVTGKRLPLKKTPVRKDPGVTYVALGKKRKIVVCQAQWGLEVQPVYTIVYQHYLERKWPPLDFAVVDVYNAHNVNFYPITDWSWLKEKTMIPKSNRGRIGWLHQRGQELRLSFKKDKRWRSFLVSKRLPKKQLFSPTCIDVDAIRDPLSKPREIAIVGDTIAFRWGNNRLFVKSEPEKGTLPTEDTRLVILS